MEDVARRLGVDTEALGRICERYGIAELQVFGSVARGQAGTTSDIDLLYRLGSSMATGPSTSASC